MYTTACRLIAGVTVGGSLLILGVNVGVALCVYYKITGKCEKIKENIKLAKPHRSKDSYELD